MNLQSACSLKAKVLVVDDDPQVLKLFTNMLETAGYSVYPTLFGVQAIEVLEREKIDLILLDLSMPEPDGFEMLKHLRTTRPDLPVVVASGFLAGPLLKAAEMFGATAVIAKTDAPMTLLPVVQDVLQRFPPAPGLGKRG